MFHKQTQVHTDESVSRCFNAAHAAYTKAIAKCAQHALHQRRFHPVDMFIEVKLELKMLQAKRTFDRYAAEFNDHMGVIDDEITY